jgi:hypothetical protein
MRAAEPVANASIIALSGDIIASSFATAYNEQAIAITSCSDG